MTSLARPTTIVASLWLAGCTPAQPLPSPASSSPPRQAEAPGSSQRGGPSESPGADRPGVAVVELFTSEGCSSCPPADRLLAELGSHEGRVITLSFHVDYWNDLGWPDPFSDAGHTQRQQAYARALGERGLYTPQMVVNGTAGFVGSERSTAQRAIEAALARPARARISLDPAIEGPRAIARYRIDPLPEGATLAVALVESEAEVRVPRGENTGKTLRHHHVVRAFTEAPLRSASGEVSLPVPHGTTRSKLSLVAYAQDEKSREVLGAAVR